MLTKDLQPRRQTVSSIVRRLRFIVLSGFKRCSAGCLYYSLNFKNLVFLWFIWLVLLYRNS